MLFRRLLDAHPVEAFEESSGRESFDVCLASFGLDFLHFCDAFRKVGE